MTAQAPTTNVEGFSLTLKEQSGEIEHLDLFTWMSSQNRNIGFCLLINGHQVVFTNKKGLKSCDIFYF